jgi:predicted RNA-binding Zn ribbon-like protein
MADVSGGAPLLGEPLSIELANTRYAVRGNPREGLDTADHLAGWLRDVRLPTSGVDAADLAAAVALRDAVRRLAAATVDDEPLPADAVDLVNRHAATPARWRELHADPEPRTVARSAGGDVATALSEIAADAVDLFGGPRRHDLRACQGPGCVLYFIRSGRREWCSHGCGNRARAARHYARNRPT